MVFPDGLPRMRDMRRDFDAAGIAAKDSQGRKADFHSLRKTFDTRLQANGVGLVTAMNLMRHSDPRLTAKTYTDSTLLPMAEAIRRLPWCGEKGTEKGTVSLVKSGSDESACVHAPAALVIAESAENTGKSADLYPCVSTGTVGMHGGGGGSRTPVRTRVTSASTRVSRD